MVDTVVLEATAEKRGGSSPFARTKTLWAAIFKGVIYAFKKRRLQGRIKNKKNKGLNNDKRK